MVIYLIVRVAIKTIALTRWAHIMCLECQYSLLHGGGHEDVLCQIIHAQSQRLPVALKTLVPAY